VGNACIVHFIRCCCCCSVHSAAFVAMPITRGLHNSLVRLQAPMHCNQTTFNIHVRPWTAIRRTCRRVSSLTCFLCRHMAVGLLHSLAVMARSRPHHQGQAQGSVATDVALPELPLSFQRAVLWRRVCVFFWKKNASCSKRPTWPGCMCVTACCERGLLCAVCAGTTTIKPQTWDIRGAADAYHHHHHHYLKPQTMNAVLSDLLIHVYHFLHVHCLIRMHAVSHQCRAAVRHPRLLRNRRLEVDDDVISFARWLRRRGDTWPWRTVLVLCLPSWPTRLMVERGCRKCSQWCPCVHDVQFVIDHTVATRAIELDAPFVAATTSVGSSVATATLQRIQVDESAWRGPHHITGLGVPSVPSSVSSWLHWVTNDFTLSLPALKILQVSGTDPDYYSPLCPYPAEGLGWAPRLTCLRLDNVMLHAPWRDWPSSQSLRAVSLSRCRVSFRWLGSLPSVETLALRRVRISDDADRPEAPLQVTRRLEVVFARRPPFVTEGPTIALLSVCGASPHLSVSPSPRTSWTALLQSLSIVTPRRLTLEVPLFGQAGRSLIHAIRESPARTSQYARGRVLLVDPIGPCASDMARVGTMLDELAEVVLEGRWSPKTRIVFARVVEAGRALADDSSSSDEGVASTSALHLWDQIVATLTTWSVVSCGTLAVSG